MRHARAIRVAALGVALSSATASTPTLAQRAPRAGPRNCVQFSQQESADGRTISFELVNRCAFPVESEVRWNVACGAASEGTTEEHREPLRPAQSHIFVASASVCGDTAWRIHGLHWSWHPQRADSDDDAAAAP